MSNTFNIADVTDFLTPASVFTREDGREARVLFVTNMNLPEKVRAKFPPQVVYADEQDNILSSSIEKFLSNRTFFNVHPELETRLNNLLAFSPSDNDDDILDLIGGLEDDAGSSNTISGLDDDGPGDSDFGDDSDDDSLEVGDAVDQNGGQRVIADADKDLELDEQEAIVTFTINDSHLPPVFDVDQLSAAVASYQQQPSADLLSTQHILFIKAEAGVNANSLDAAFSPASVGRNQTLEFAVDLNGNGQFTEIDWSTFIGVYPCVFYGSRMFQVIFSQPNVSPGMQLAINTTVAEAAPALSAAIEQAAAALSPAVAAAISDTPAVAVANPAAVVAVAPAPVAAPAPAPVSVQVQTPAPTPTPAPASATVQVRVAAPAGAVPTAMQQALANAQAGPQ